MRQTQTSLLRFNSMRVMKPEPEPITNDFGMSLQSIGYFDGDIEIADPILASSMSEQSESTTRVDDRQEAGIYTDAVGGDYGSYVEEEDSTSRHWQDQEDEIKATEKKTKLRKRPDTATKVVWCTKALALIVLFLSAATAGALTYVLLAGDENEDFKSAFNANAQDIANVAFQNAGNIFNSIRTFAALYTDYALRNSNGDIASNSNVPPGFIVLPDFETFAVGTRKVAGVSLVAYSPYLKSAAQRLLWEDYSVLNQDWIAHSLVQEQKNKPHQQQQAMTAGNVHDVFQRPLDPIVPYIWRESLSTGAIEVDPGPAPFLPLWQMSPPPTNTSVINLDLISGSVEFAEIGDYTLNTAEPTLSRPIHDVQKLFGSNLPDLDTPQSVFVEPVLSSFNSAQAVVMGTITAVIPWESYFSNVFPKDSHPLGVVVESCGVNSTFILNGPEATFLGAGDLHDAQYDDMAVSVPFVLARNSGPGDPGGQNRQCLHYLHIFPTKELQDAYETNAPMIYTFVVVCIFLFAVVVFFIYDFIVTIRQNRTETEANRTDAIIAQIFPAQIREKLFISEALSKEKARNVTKSGKRKKKKRSDRNPGDEGFDNASLDEFMKQGLEEEARAREAARAIAELYPETTIMFADVPGFTAWSSIREPAHVFMLLEAIFQAFDESANRRRVFKIETVGDCYVAAVGVPEACPDHALVMARYARDCMVRFHDVVQGLELTLGPDTSELGLRVGLHSGPITGGVLRGDRARFQLFGDTMNTTARVQTSGLRDCIHVSEQTAKLLLEAGKKKWLVQRADQVQAKGKGILKTYWLKTKAREQSQSNDFSESEGDHGMSDSFAASELDLIESQAVLKSMDAMLAVEKTETPMPTPTPKTITGRLVAWNSELLLKLLRQVVLQRQAVHQSENPAKFGVNELARNLGKGRMVVEEVAEIISLPEFNEKAQMVKNEDFELSDLVVSQLHEYVARIASMYKDNPFHNFEHASHVTMSVSKLLSRIVAPKIDTSVTEDDRKKQELLHDHTYGITSDPLTQFALVLSALIHDVDHRGVPNFLLMKEDKSLSDRYENKSIAEQNSVDVAWQALMSDDFEELRGCIFANGTELRRFRQLLVNSVIATDIFDKDQGTLRKTRWKKAFEEKDGEETREDKNRKATIVIEHIIQASDVSHTMQHWQVYQKWNQKLFMEMYQAFVTGRSDKNPAANWYQGELEFYDNYIIPLAKKLKECGVFGVSSDEYLNYAELNRRDWKELGEKIVEEMVANCQQTFNINSGD